VKSNFYNKKNLNSAWIDVDINFFVAPLVPPPFSHMLQAFKNMAQVRHKLVHDFP